VALEIENGVRAPVASKGDDGSLLSAGDQLMETLFLLSRPHRLCSAETWPEPVETAGREFRSKSEGRGNQSGDLLERVAAFEVRPGWPGAAGYSSLSIETETNISLNC
jgi:hypothetical protein